MRSPRILGILALFTGCETVPSRAPARAANAPVSLALPHFPEGKAERVRSRALDFPIELMLPAKASWRLSDGPIWLEAEHPESSSKFAWRTWRAERLVRRDDCAAQARLGRPAIPIVDDETVIDRRPFVAPRGFDSELVVGVEPSAHGVAGYAIVFGASVGFCYAAVFTTTASGAGAGQEVAARLGLAVDGVLSGVHTRSVDERAPRRRLLGSPVTRQPKSGAANQSK